MRMRVYMLLQSIRSEYETQARLQAYRANNSLFMSMGGRADIACHTMAGHC